MNHSNRHDLAEGTLTGSVWRYALYPCARHARTGAFRVERREAGRGQISVYPLLPAQVFASAKNVYFTVGVQQTLCVVTLLGLVDDLERSVTTLW